MLQRGFSLIELLLVIILLGIISIVVFSRVDNSNFDASVAAQDLVEAIRYAQHRSMNASGNTYFEIAISNSGYAVTQGGNVIANPTTGTSPYTDDGWATKGITTNASVTVVFNSRGIPYVSGSELAAALVIQVFKGAESSTVRLEELTGYAHRI